MIVIKWSFTSMHMQAKRKGEKKEEEKRKKKFKYF